MLNTAHFSWKHIELSVNGRIISGLQNIRFDETQQKDYVYGTGVEPQKIRGGNKRYEGTLTVLQGEYEQLAMLSSTGSALDLVDVNIQVSVDNLNESGGLVTYSLNGVSFMSGNGLDAQQGAIALQKEIPFLALGVVVQRQ